MAALVIRRDPRATQALLEPGEDESERGMVQEAPLDGDEVVTAELEQAEPGRASKGTHGEASAVPIARRVCGHDLKRLGRFMPAKSGEAREPRGRE